jgi:starch synthase (maltosyl-transferring)
MTEYEEGRTRIVIEGVKPEINEGRFPIKRIVGDRIVAEADIFVDGHEKIPAHIFLVQ